MFRLYWMFQLKIIKFLGLTVFFIFYYLTNRFDLSNKRWHLLFFWDVAAIQDIQSHR